MKNSNSGLNNPETIEGVRKNKELLKEFDKFTEEENKYLEKIDTLDIDSLSQRSNYNSTRAFLVREYMNYLNNCTTKYSQKLKEAKNKKQ